MFNINGISILNNLRTISSYQETRLCGFVIYDETDAVMKRVMNDSNIFRMLDDISASGIATAFIIYPQTIVNLTSVGWVNALFGVIFYLMLAISEDYRLLGFEP